MSKPYDVKVSKVTDVKLLQEWYDACVELADESDRKLQPLRAQLSDIYYKVNNLESEYKKSRNKARILKEKLDALRALDSCTFHTWYELGYRIWGKPVFFYPTQQTPSGRVRGWQVVYRSTANLFVTVNKKQINIVGPTYEVVEITYSAALMERLNKLKYVIQEGRNIEGELNLIVKTLNKNHGRGFRSGWTIYEGKTVRIR